MHVTPLVNRHPMVTQAKDGFQLPRDRLTLVVAATSTRPSAIPIFVCVTHRSELACGYGMRALMSNGTWELVPRPLDSNVITRKWIFTYKFLSDRTFGRYKTHWVLWGITQHPRVDYDETFSPVVK
jgi:hypothetical protein